MTNPPVDLGEYGRAFAQNLKAVRRSRGVTVAELLTLLGDRGYTRLNADKIIRIEAGQRYATADDICHIAHALQVNALHLLRPSHLQLVPNAGSAALGPTKERLVI